MICTRTHLDGGTRILAACDEDIVGKTFRGDGLRITVFGSFYKDRVVTEEEFIDMMDGAQIMNLVGNRVVDLAIESGFVDEKRVIKIGEVRHAQVVRS